MKNNKKLIGLLIGLACLVLGVVLLLTLCGEPKAPSQPTEPTGTQQPATTQPPEETTEPEPSTAPTEEETTQEPTEEETTQEPTQDQGSGNDINHGTGGGYDPQATQPEQETTEPEQDPAGEVDVPAAGTKDNRYYEALSQAPGSFTTVKIPAGGKMYYTLKLAGALLQVESDDVSIVYKGKTYKAKDGLIQLPLSEKQPMQVQFVNSGKKARSFQVSTLEEEGKASNPIRVKKLDGLSIQLIKNDQDGLYYAWKADRSGILTLSLANVKPASAQVELTVTVNDETMKLSDFSGGALEIPVEKDDQVTVQVQAQAGTNGKVPAVQVQLGSFIADVTQLNVPVVPYKTNTAKLAAGTSVYYSITGANGTVMTLSGGNGAVVYDGTTYTADKSGKVTVNLAPGEDIDSVDLKLVNNGSKAQSFKLHFAYPVGHRENPQKLSKLGSLQVNLTQGTQGYFYSYTPKKSGAVLFTVTTPAAGENTRTDITVINTQTQEEASLWTEGTQQKRVALEVTEGEALLICVKATDPYTFSELCVDAQVTVHGQLSAYIPLEYPGGTLNVPAGSVQYYESYNIGGTTFRLEGENVSVTHNGVTYIPKDGKLSFQVEAEGRMPARFIVENTGDADAAYQVTLTYPVGSMMNPGVLALGNSFVNQPAGASEYCFNYTAPKAGQVVFTFDPAANWVYTVDNLTAGTYGEIQYSDSDPAVPETAVDVQQGDVVQIRVNTYDPAEPFSAPAGTVSFETALHTFHEIHDVTVPVEASILVGETAHYQGLLQGTVLSLQNAQKITLGYEGKTYGADEGGNLGMTFLKPDDAGSYSFSLMNWGAEQWDSTLTLSVINGGPKAPGELLLGEGETSTPAGGVGYWFSYTAPKAGQLVLTLDGEANWRYAVNSGAIVSSDEADSNVITQDVQSGEQTLIWLSTYDPENPDTAPEGVVKFKADLFSEPVTLEDLTVPYQTEVVFAETAKFTGDLRNIIVTVENARSAVAVYNGEEYTANARGDIKITFLEPDSDGNWVFTLRNNGEAQSFTLSFDGVTGSWLHPDALQLGTNTVELAENAADYHYSYIAPKDGLFELSFDQNSHWQYTLDHLTNEVFGLTQYSGTGADKVTLEVKAGDEILLRINTFDPENLDTLPAGTVSFEADLITGPHTVEDLLSAFSVDLVAGETAVVTGELRNVIVTLADAGDAVLTYNGTEYVANDDNQIQVTILEPDSEGNWTFTLKNGAEDRSFKFGFEGLTGHWMNPAELKLAQNDVTLEAGAADYNYSYTAPKAGTLVFVFDPSADWRYCINEQSVHVSTEPGADTVEIELAAGATVYLAVNTYDPEAPESTPAGTVSFDATLITGPLQISDTSQPTIASIMAGETLRITGDMYGERLTIMGAQGLALRLNGELYLPDEDQTIQLTLPEADGEELLEFTLYNGNENDGSYSLAFGNPVGTPMNPAELIIGKNVATCQQGGSGYHYQFTATKTNYTLRLIFTAGTKWKVIYNGKEYDSETTYINQSTQTQTLNLGKKFTVGEPVPIIVMTYDPANPDVVPSGSVEFEVTYKK